MSLHPVSVTDEYLAAILAELQRIREELASLNALQRESEIELHEPVREKKRR